MKGRRWGGGVQHCGIGHASNHTDKDVIRNALRVDIITSVGRQYILQVIALISFQIKMKERGSPLSVVLFSD